MAWTVRTVVAVSAVSVAAVAAAVYLASRQPAAEHDVKAGGKAKAGKKKKNRHPRKKSTAKLPDSAVSSESETAAVVSSGPEQAKELKAKGNTLFIEKQYEKAIEAYSQAISLDPQAIYFNNRAACQIHLKEFEKAILDCSEALKRDPLYVKALNRRASAYEASGDIQKALNDFSALCVLEEFKNQQTITHADRVLKLVGDSLAAEQIKNKPERLPSYSFITSYLESYAQTSSHIQDLMALDFISEADNTLRESIEFLAKKEYKPAMDKAEECFNCQLNADGVLFSTLELEGLAHNLRGTFRFLVGNLAGALSDFDASIKACPKDAFLDSYIKRASLYLEMGYKDRAFEEFEVAARVDPDVADVYYHRGQLKHLTGDVSGSTDDFKKALALNPELIYAHIQLAVAIYKEGDVEGSLKAFADAEAKFPARGEILNYKGEIYLDQGHHDKGMLYLQNKNDPISAEKLLKQAIDLDPLSDIAYGPLAQLYLTQNKVDEAVVIYNRAIEYARTEQELSAAFCCREAAVAQLNIKDQYPDIYRKLVAAQLSAMQAAQTQR